jgi:hypothetical protein
VPERCLQISHAIDYATFRSRLHDAVIRVYDEAGNVSKTHEAPAKAKLAGSIETHPGDHLAALSAFRIARGARQGFIAVLA